MQTILAIVFALVMAPAFIVNDSWLAVPKYKLFTSKIATVFFIIITLFTLLPSIYINKQVYESLKVKK
jgi:hypothetical protein